MAKTKEKPIELWADRLVREHDENVRKLQAANAMLAALKDARMFNLHAAKSQARPWTRVDAAIAQAEAAGIKGE